MRATTSKDRPDRHGAPQPAPTPGPPGGLRVRGLGVPGLVEPVAFMLPYRLGVVWGG